MALRPAVSGGLPFMTSSQADIAAAKSAQRLPPPGGYRHLLPCVFPPAGRGIPRLTGLVCDLSPYSFASRRFRRFAEWWCWMNCLRSPQIMWFSHSIVFLRTILFRLTVLPRAAVPRSGCRLLSEQRYAGPARSGSRHTKSASSRDVRSRPGARLTESANRLLLRHILQIGK